MSNNATATPTATGEEAGMPKDLSFSEALVVLKRGGTVSRAGWNGKNMWLDLVSADKYTALNIHNGLLPWIGMKTADSRFVPWVASQTDMLVEDWEVITNPPREEE